MADGRPAQLHNFGAKLGLFATVAPHRESRRGGKHCKTVNDAQFETLELTVADHRVSKSSERSSQRRAVSVPARLTWKDASGAVRFASVTTRDVSEAGVFVECEAGAAIPLYRLVHLQVERSTRQCDQLPSRLREGRVLSAVWRVGPCRRSTGTPSGYALRFLVEPAMPAALIHAAPAMEAVAV